MMSAERQPLGRTQRRTARWLAMGLILASVLLVGFFASPLLFSSHPVALTSGGEPTLREGLAASPSEGSTETTITLSATGLPHAAAVSVLGGIDQASMQPLAEGRTDSDGNFSGQVQIPEWAERGKPFYFALEQSGQRLGTASVNVIVIENVAPSGV